MGVLLFTGCGVPVISVPPEAPCWGTEGAEAGAAAGELESAAAAELAGAAAAELAGVWLWRF